MTDEYRLMPNDQKDPAWTTQSANPGSDCTSPNTHLTDAGESHATSTKKLYEKPELVMYGALMEITQAVAGSHANDGGGHHNKHFTS
jgi:hypothetical protein